MPMAGGYVFFVLWILMMLGMVIGWIVFLVAVWRLMRAHEALAMSAQEVADNLRAER